MSLLENLHDHNALAATASELLGPTVWTSRYVHCSHYVLYICIVLLGPLNCLCLCTVKPVGLFITWVDLLLSPCKGNFHLSGRGEVLKLFSEVEAKCLDLLMTDTLRPFVPQYRGLVTRQEGCFIRLEDLLSGLNRPAIMDCKMGVRCDSKQFNCCSRSNKSSSGG